MPSSEGLLDTCVIIDLNRYDVNSLPDTAYISAVTMAELSFGVALAKSAVEAAVRSQVFAATKAWIQPLPFDAAAADRFGELAALVLAAGRQPRPRRMDLMIAATAVANHLTLYTANSDDYRGLESILTVRSVRSDS
ncbi:MAG: type II toxin-antitoxin system VapC family toxin [Propionibacteriaceae bacterium]|nr:type II toxin-antitoxin system VapC family toxin [Propionibacteriaceae bacterium]